MIELRPYQQDAIEASFEYLKNKTGNPIVVLPTGTGKSLLIAEFIRRTYDEKKGRQFIMLTHVKELIEQNLSALKSLWPEAPVGIYSAGLKKRNINYITFAGIASVVRKADVFGKVDYVLIDECHLVSPEGDTMYAKFIADLSRCNPDLRVLGYTATPYRLKSGKLTDGKIFTDICYDLSNTEGFKYLIKKKYLAPLVTKKPEKELDLNNIKITAGDYNLKQLQERVNKQQITEAAVDEVTNYGKDRNHWLVFTSGVEHADDTAEILNQKGITAAAVHSKMPDSERDRIIADFRAGKIRAVTNNNVLTTGFDYPDIDLICVLRPTISTGLWVQMLGRGTRPANGKKNCLVMDFAGNTVKLGTIDNPVLHYERSGNGNGEPPVKVCLKCGTYNHTKAKVCTECGKEFEFELKIKATASFDPVMGEPEPCIYDVVDISFDRHYSAWSPYNPASFKITYRCKGKGKINEWLCFEHGGFPSKKARKKWTEITGKKPPYTVDAALNRSNEIPFPAKIRVIEENNFPKIVERIYNE